MKIVNYIIVLVTILTLTSCPENINPIDATLAIINNSDIDVVYTISGKKISDTSLKTNVLTLLPSNFENGLIPSHSLQISDNYRVSFKKMSKDEVMMVYLFSRDTIEQVPWTEITDRYLVLKRFDLIL